MSVHASGFLCAGVIMREGFNISGLTTAAPLWASSVIGILAGVGFYPAAVAIALKFKKDFRPAKSTLRQAADARGYDIAGGVSCVALRCYWTAAK